MKVRIVGASGKLGRNMVQHSLDRGHEVVGVCRPQSMSKLAKFEDARHDIVATTGSTAVTVIELDLSSVASVRACAREFHDPFRSSTC